jgi:hypothetical protein
VEEKRKLSNWEGACDYQAVDFFGEKQDVLFVCNGAAALPPSSPSTATPMHRALHVVRNGAAVTKLTSTPPDYAGYALLYTLTALTVLTLPQSEWDMDTEEGCRR